MKATLDTLQREFPMSPANFETIRQLAAEHTGIVLGNHKKEMVYSRLARRIRSLGLSSFDDYCGVIKDPKNEEFGNFINSITTNLTSFFREQHHFEFLKNKVLPELKIENKVNKKIRIWSAGCSTGEESYSIAITLKQGLFDSSWDNKILATDLDTNVLDKGRSGVYESSRVDDIDQNIVSKWFLKSSSNVGDILVKPELQDMIVFKQLNLLGLWPMKGPFDVIFCRNVVIYFDKDTQKKLFERYADILKPRGYLIIGHSESLHKISDRFEPMGKTIYRKID